MVPDDFKVPTPKELRKILKRLTTDVLHRQVADVFAKARRGRFKLVAGGRPRHRTLAIVPILFVLVGNVFPEERLLKKVPQLQETAYRPNCGQLGDGRGTITLITSRGQVKAESNLDPIRVFGNTIKVFIPAAGAATLKRS